MSHKRLLSFLALGLVASLLALAAVAPAIAPAKASVPPTGLKAQDSSHVDVDIQGQTYTYDILIAQDGVTYVTADTFVVSTMAAAFGTTAFVFPGTFVGTAIVGTTVTSIAVSSAAATTVVFV